MGQNPASGGTLGLTATLSRKPAAAESKFDEITKALRSVSRGFHSFLQRADL